MEFAGEYTSFFDVARRNVADKARCYLAGLLMKAPRKNMECMEEYVEEFDYQAQQQFLSDSPWDHRELMDRIARDAGALLGGPDCGLLIDETGFAKKGTGSVGVARQWIGRLGKQDNGQVGVFAALGDGVGSALIDGRLYLPEEWAADPGRCRKAKVPEAEQVFRTKLELALESIRNAVALGLDFGWVGFDAFYGSAPWLLREIDGMGLVFVGDVRTNQAVYGEDPRPFVPQGRSGRAGRPRTAAESEPIAESFSGDLSIQWEEIEIRDGTRGTLRVSACRKRVWLWDGTEDRARCWWAVCTLDEASGDTKFFLSNAPEDATLRELVRRHAVRFWVERGFQDAKTSLGMADYQARGWKAWHHHMAMVMLAMLFLLRERRVHMVDVEMLSCQDVVELLNHFLPRRDLTLDAVLENIERRHRKRTDAIESARRRDRLLNEMRAATNEF
jgi:SRSO17 transposase